MYNNQASDKAYNYIVEKIQEGYWKPGDKIATEPQLCEAIQVSRVPVRQAIEKLVALSVLKKIQGSGTYVEQPENMSVMSALVLGSTMEQELSILEFRKMFDSYNIELFIKRCSYGEVAQLEENYRAMVQAKDSLCEFQHLDKDFHSIIANGTRNPMIIQIENLFTSIWEANQKSMYQNVGPESAIKYHGLMLQSIKEKNSELASIYARMSIEDSIRRLSGPQAAESWETERGREER